MYFSALITVCVASKWELNISVTWKVADAKGEPTICCSRYVLVTVFNSDANGKHNTYLDFKQQIITKNNCFQYIIRIEIFVKFQPAQNGEYSYENKHGLSGSFGEK